MSDRIFTSEESAYFTKEVNAFVLPAFTRFFNILWFGFFRYYIFIVFCIIFIAAIIYHLIHISADTYYTLSIILRYLFFSSFGIGLWAACSFVVKEQAIKNKAKALGLTFEEWNSFMNYY